MITHWRRQLQTVPATPGDRIEQPTLPETCSLRLFILNGANIYLFVGEINNIVLVAKYKPYHRGRRMKALEEDMKI